TLRREIDTLHPVDQDARLRTEALRISGADPLRFVRLSVRRLVTLYSPFSRIDTPNHVRTTAARLIAALSFLPVLALGLAGAVLTLRAAPASWIVHATVLMPTLVYAVLTAATRFRLPIDTLWILLASFSAITLLDRVRSGRRGATAAPAAPA
ncbi:MAG TPA: hypothetical protein VMN60_07130, partial [Longimicrobiales bacterium]|nr:hypothetical protein [Longimicrobiales bacterium]